MECFYTEFSPKKFLSNYSVRKRYRIWKCFRLPKHRFAIGKTRVKQRRKKPNCQPKRNCLAKSSLWHRKLQQHEMELSFHTYYPRLIEVKKSVHTEMRICSTIILVENVFWSVQESTWTLNNHIKRRKRLNSFFTLSLSRSPSLFPCYPLHDFDISLIIHRFVIQSRFCYMFFRLGIKILA